MLRPQTSISSRGWTGRGVWPSAITFLFFAIFPLYPSLVLSYPGDISSPTPTRSNRSPLMQPRGPVGVPGLVLPRKNAFSRNASNRRARKRDGVAAMVGSPFDSVTREDCIGRGLEKCGDMCAAQCCNAESSLACPVNSYCTSNGEYEFCCEKGHTCDEPRECLNLADSRCASYAGGLVLEGGIQKGCCYTGFDICTTIWDGFPACMPENAKVPPKPKPKPTKLSHCPSSFDPDLGVTSGFGCTITKDTPTQALITVATHTSAETETPVVTPADTTHTGANDGFSETGLGTIVGAIIGGFFGLGLLYTAVIFTSRYYRRKWRDDIMSDDGCGDDSGGGSRGSTTWEKWIESPRIQASLSSWSSYDTTSSEPGVVRKAADEGIMDSRQGSNSAAPASAPTPTSTPISSDSPPIQIPEPAASAAQGFWEWYWYWYWQHGVPGKDTPEPPLVPPKSPTIGPTLAPPKSPTIGPIIPSSQDPITVSAPEPAASPPGFCHWDFQYGRRAKGMSDPILFRPKSPTIGPSMASMTGALCDRGEVS